MKVWQETVTRREGEMVGPVDWNYDFEQHGWNRNGSTNPQSLTRRVEMLKQLSGGGEWEATTYGGWPRTGWGRVVAIGMYDGWPYWTPVPSVCIEEWHGRSWASFLSIADIRQAEGTAHDH